MKRVARFKNRRNDVLWPLAETIEAFLRKEYDWNTGDFDCRKVCPGCGVPAPEAHDFCCICGTGLIRNEGVDDEAIADIEKALKYSFKKNGFNLTDLRKIRKKK